MPHRLRGIRRRATFCRNFYKRKGDTPDRVGRKVAIRRRHRTKPPG